MKEFLGIVVWLGLVYVVHNWLWGGYEPPSEDFMMFFLIDNAVLAAVVLPVMLIGSWLRKKNER